MSRLSVRNGMVLLSNLGDTADKKRKRKKRFRKRGKLVMIDFQ
jgi:hypothetical protein